MTYNEDAFRALLALPDAAPSKPSSKDRTMSEKLSDDACTVRDGRFVVPCGTLAAQTDTDFAGFSKAKGIARWHYINLKTREPSRTFYGVKSKASPNGFLFNFCPFCGSKIDAPFADDGNEAERQKGGEA